MARNKKDEAVEAPVSNCDRCDCAECPGLDADPSLLADHSKVCAEKHF